MKLLAVSQDAKTVKGEKLGFLTGILYLSPANESGIANVCPFSTPGCRAACLYTAGRSAYFPKINLARIRKTKELFSDRTGFLTDLRSDIRALIARAGRLNLKPCVRINGTSDLPWLARQMAREFPDVQFYDYTKIPQPWKRTEPNYHLTFSLSESNEPQAVEALQHGINVAAVFDTKKGEPLPQTWHGFPIVSGDESDLRFLDRSGVVIGLYAKGKAKHDTSGFVQAAKNFVPLSTLAMTA